MNLTDIEYKEDGLLVWNRTKGRAICGKPVGNKSKYGYIETKVQNKRLKVHHIVWYLHKGYFPVRLDHINRDRTDNRIENLRECTAQENNRNRSNDSVKRKLPRNVYTSKSVGKYRVLLSMGGKSLCFGTFSNVADADIVAKQARELYYGDFAGS